MVVKKKVKKKVLPKTSNEIDKVSANKEKPLENKDQSMKNDPKLRGIIDGIVKAASLKVGSENIRRMGDNTIASKVKGFVPIGNEAIHQALGLPGLPMGRIVEIFGPESSGKSTVALTAAAKCQAMGGIVVYIDTEFALDPDRATTLGVFIEDVLLSQPESMEQAIQVIEDMIEVIRSKDKNVPILIVWDSVAASPTELELKDGKALPAEHARLMSSHLRKIRGLISKASISMIYINQIRQKIGVMFGEDTETFGGRALKFYSSIRLEVKRVGQIKSGENVIGAKTRITVKKNKLAPPFKKAEFAIMWDVGIAEDIWAFFEMGINAELFGRAGRGKYSYISLDGEEIIFTKKTFEGFVADYPEIKQRLSGVPISSEDEDE